MRHFLGEDGIYKNVILISRLDIQEMLQEAGDADGFIAPPIVGNFYRDNIEKSPYRPPLGYPRVQIDSNLDNYLYAPPKDRFVDWLDEDFSLPEWARKLGFYLDKTLYFFAYKIGKQASNTTIFNPLLEDKQWSHHTQLISHQKPRLRA